LKALRKLINGDAIRSHAKRVETLYQLILGRLPESQSAAENTFGLSAAALLTNLVASDEFRFRVIEPMLRSDPPDSSWLAGSRADAAAADVLLAAGATNIDFLHLIDPLERLSSILQLPAAQQGLRHSLSEHEALQFIAAIQAGDATRTPPAEIVSPDAISVTPRLSKRLDLRNAYRLILAREPEAGALENNDRVAIPIPDLLSGFFRSAEFIDNFIRPSTRHEPPIAGYHEPIPSDLREWVVGLDVGSATRSRVLDAETVGELVNHVLRDERLGHALDAAEIKLFLSLYPSIANKTQSSLRPELRRLKLGKYPSGFNWQAYLHRNPGVGRTRWAALSHLLDRPAWTDRLPPTFDDGKAEFLSALGAAFVGRDDRYAALLLEAASRLRPLSSAELEYLGDAMAAQQLNGHALTHYMSAISTCSPTLSLLLKATKSAILLYDLESALHLLRQSERLFGKQPKWRDFLLQYFEATLHKAADIALSCYTSGDRAQGDAVLLGWVKDTEAEFLELYPLGVAIPTDGHRRIIVYAEVNLLQCKHYRVDQKIVELTALGYRPELYKIDEGEKLIQSLPGAEALIVYRYPAWPTVIKAILVARSLGIPIFFEIDDLLFDSAHYPDSFASYGGQIDFKTYIDLQFGVPLFKAAAQLCDYGIASTEPLANELRKTVRSGKAWVVPNSLDDRIERTVAVSRPARPDTVTLFYGTGTRAHNSDFDELVAPALLQTLASRPQARLLIVGHLTLAPEFEPYLTRIIKMDFVEPVEAYWQLLASADINIAVLNPSLMADCKSEIKWLEAAAFSIPSVVSPTAAYRQALTDGHDALLTETPQDWAAAFERLIDDPSLRDRLGQAAKATAQTHFSQQVATKALGAGLDYVRSTRTAPSVKPKLMLANVYFPPQTIGGATRVLKDNVDAFIDLGLSEDFDLAILTTDAGVHPAGKLSIDSYRGLPVFRISTPEEVNMDWRPANPAIGAVFARICDIWKADFLHFHCIQRLTGSVIDICRQNRIPYVITVHDAWWISDYQFLTDDLNQIVDPSPGAVKPPPPTGVTDVQSRNRLLYLKSLLDGAEVVLGVSGGFSDIYRSAGIQNIKTVANGLPKLTLETRYPSPDGRVRLAHVGNVTAHKGFPLVRRALMEGQFSNLRLTAVDHSRRPGEVYTEVWGETLVDIVGPLSQDAMPSFYARHDVLLAPSIWPESFGLVTREALAAGLWVVASDRGAIGEAVIPGVNGFVVDVQSHAPLQQVFADLDANAQRYLRSPTPTKLRSSDDQARDLMGLYREAMKVKARDVERSGA
jgi:glycosyltransferase involved in cell wall biosynthesis